MKNTKITPHTFKQVLANEEGRSIIEGIEGLDSSRPDHQPLYRDYQRQLKEKFGFVYETEEWDNK